MLIDEAKGILFSFSCPSTTWRGCRKLGKDAGNSRIPGSTYTGDFSPTVLLFSLPSKHPGLEISVPKLCVVPRGINTKDVTARNGFNGRRHPWHCHVPQHCPQWRERGSSVQERNPRRGLDWGSRLCFYQALLRFHPSPA